MKLNLTKTSLLQNKYLFDDGADSTFPEYPVAQSNMILKEFYYRLYSMDRFNTGFHLYLNKVSGKLIVRQEGVRESLPFSKVEATPLIMDMIKDGVLVAE